MVKKMVNKRFLIVWLVIAAAVFVTGTAAFWHWIKQPCVFREDVRGKGIHVEDIKRLEEKEKDGAMGILRIAGWRTEKEQSVFSASTGRKEKAEVILGMKDGETVGFALFFHNFSTFLGRAGIYLEDLYVRPEYRGQGFGTAFLNRLAAIAVERGCGRLEWWCLDWNKPSIDFYLGMGAQAMSDWTVYRIDGERLKAMAVTAQG